jgi:putative alpha-1,2-mannosidase
LVPQQGNLKTSPAYRTKNGFGATFKHANEKATPGFYSVSLNNGINVRLTATKRCALHEYTFTSDNEKKFVLIDLGYRDQVIDAGIKAIDKNHVQGFRRSNAWARDQHVYFDLTTNVPFSKSKIVLNKKKNKYYMILEFPKECKQVMVAVSLSGTTVEGAALNKKAELTSWDFDAVAKNAANEWRNELSKVQAFTKRIFSDRNKICSITCF